MVAALSLTLVVAIACGGAEEEAAPAEEAESGDSEEPAEAADDAEASTD